MLFHPFTSLFIEFCLTKLKGGEGTLKEEMQSVQIAVSRDLVGSVHVDNMVLFIKLFIGYQKLHATTFIITSGQKTDDLRQL